jgi:hypothetical protein
LTDDRATMDVARSPIGGHLLVHPVPRTAQPVENLIGYTIQGSLVTRGAPILSETWPNLGAEAAIVPCVNTRLACLNTLWRYGNLFQNTCGLTTGSGSFLQRAANARHAVDRRPHLAAARLHR